MEKVFKVKDSRSKTKSQMKYSYTLYSKMYTSTQKFILIPKYLLFKIIFDKVLTFSSIFIKV